MSSIALCQDWESCLTSVLIEGVGGWGVGGFNCHHNLGGWSEDSAPVSPDEEAEKPRGR